jgi:hypothetical protein
MQAVAEYVMKLCVAAALTYGLNAWLLTYFKVTTVLICSIKWCQPVLHFVDTDARYIESFNLPTEIEYAA